jgi:Tol biopolymer transport system component
VTVLDSVANAPTLVSAALSPSGSLLYLNGSTGSTLVRAALGEPDVPLLGDVREYFNPRYSPSGREVAVQVGAAVARDIWLVDLGTRVLERRTTGLAYARPEWTPDGLKILMRSGVAGSGRRDVAAIRADGGGGVEVLHRTHETMMEVVMSPDGQWLVYRTPRIGTGSAG